ncbi:hypothetical protein [Pseudomonas juntendi]|uniref:hypothetical protein n=1 Tax=Pseudomonas juntendi TaxID=2666183 RepID=UPI001F2ACFA7|nr:hypothetical protein [Pseudomonas juntendi]MCO7058289.1 hypothetical protein [Pseudomonas juntendi]UJM15261.1 hypothetical protein L1P09_25960 [Pseudomonas juntendi]
MTTTLITREDVKRYQGRDWFRRAVTMVSTGGQRVYTTDGRALNTLEELQAEDAPTAIEPEPRGTLPKRQRFYGEDRKSVRVHARMTEDYRKRFIALGGSTWLRKQIDAALPQLNA